MASRQKQTVRVGGHAKGASLQMEEGLVHYPELPLCQPARTPSRITLWSAPAGTPSLFLNTVGEQTDDQKANHLILMGDWRRNEALEEFAGQELWENIPKRGIR